MLIRKLAICFFIMSFSINGIAQDGLKGIVLTTADQSVSDKWNKTISDTMPKLSSNTDFRIGQKFFIIPFIWQYSFDKSNQADVNYDIKVLSPSGKIYFSGTGIVSLKRKILQSNVMMSEKYIYISFDPSDEKGIYTIDIILHDLITNKNLSISSSIELRDRKKEERVFIDNNDFSSWIQNYFSSKEPEDTVSALQYYFKSGMSDDETTWPPILSFYVSILRDNQWLTNDIFEMYNKLDIKKKTRILEVFQYLLSNKEVMSFCEKLPQVEKKILKKFSSKEKLFNIEKINLPLQLDCLWGAFFATGKYEYIALLVNTLNSQNMDSDLVKASLWSIKSNCHQYKLINDYCKYLLQYDDSISIEKKDILNKIIAK